MQELRTGVNSEAGEKLYTPFPLCTEAKNVKECRKHFHRIIILVPPI